MRIKDFMGGIKVKEIMSPHCTPVDPSMTIMDALRNQFVEHNYGTLPVAAGKRLLGLITLSEIKRLPRSKWVDTKVFEVMNKVSKNNSLHLEERAASALTKMVKTRMDLLPVVEDSSFKGVVTQEDLLEVIRNTKLKKDVN